MKVEVSVETAPERRGRDARDGDGIRVVFFGTPEFAVPSLEALATHPAFTVVAVVTQPDRPSGRGRRMEASAVKRNAVELDLPLYQPPTLRDAASRRPLEEMDADLFVVAAYGLIFGPRTLAIPRVGCVNLHASLLPNYRGASPISAAILAGDERTGVSLMVMEPGLDTGPVIATVDEEIRADDTTGTLTARLAARAAALATEALPPFVRGETVALPQPSGATLTRPLTKADGWLDWQLPAEDLERRVRAMWPWPRAWTTIGADPLQVHRATALPGPRIDVPGTVRVDDGTPVVACGQGEIRLDALQMAGGRTISGPEAARGRRLRDGDLLGTNPPPLPPPLLQEVDASL